MKNQYFGDRNDYFKYDLMLSLVAALEGINRFTFVPMLTPDDGSSDGQLINYVRGNRREELFNFLGECVRGGLRDIAQLRGFLDGYGGEFQYCPYRDREVFCHAGRQEYFRRIPEGYLQDAIVLLDPDNGLEVKSATKQSYHKYVRYDEVARLYQGMCDQSVLGIYQHFPRVDRVSYLKKLFAQLQRKAGCSLLISISDNRIAFILLTKSPARKGQVEEILGKYAAGEQGLRVL